MQRINETLCTGGPGCGVRDLLLLGPVLVEMHLRETVRQELVRRSLLPVDVIMA